MWIDGLIFDVHDLITMYLDFKAFHSLEFCYILLLLNISIFNSDDKHHQFLYALTTKYITHNSVDIRMEWRFSKIFGKPTRNRVAYPMSEKFKA